LSLKIIKFVNETSRLYTRLYIFSFLIFDKSETIEIQEPDLFRQNKDVKLQGAQNARKKGFYEGIIHYLSPAGDGLTREQVSLLCCNSLSFKLPFTNSKTKNNRK